MDTQQITEKVEKEEKKDGKVNWLDLLTHLIASITNKLFLVKDCISFGAVYRLWRSVYTKYMYWRCPPWPLPLLMVPPPTTTTGKEEEDDGKVNLLDLLAHLIASITNKLFLVKDYISFGAFYRSWRSVYTKYLCRHCPPRPIPLLMVPPTTTTGKEEEDDAEKQEEEGKVNWLDLPDHLIASIADKLFLAKDYINFGAVCRSWRSVYTNNLDSDCSLRRLPLLLVPPDEDDKGTCSVYSLSDNGVIPHIKLRVPHDRYCRGSSEGWLITLHQNLTDIHLLHPFSGAEIELPPTTTLPSRYFKIPNQSFIDKAILSANPSLKPNYNFVVMVIYGGRNQLALYKSGDPTWTPLNFSSHPMRDVIYCRERFYAVDVTGKVYAYDPNQPHQELIIVAQPPEFNYVGKKNYLVDCDGNLLLIARLRKVNADKTSKPTSSFEVFKLEESSPTSIATWTRLQSLGNHALFLGSNSSLSLLASNLPGCRPDCIYFTEDDVEWYCFYVNGAHDIGLCNLADGTFERHFPIKSNLVFPIPIWIQQSPPFSHSHN